MPKLTASQQWLRDELHFLSTTTGPRTITTLELSGAQAAYLHALIESSGATDPWQDISTAPQDGHAIIGSNATESAPIRWRRAITYAPDSPRCDEPEGWYYCGDGWRSGRMSPAPTHWQPFTPRKA